MINWEYNHVSKMVLSTPESEEYIDKITIFSPTPSRGVHILQMVSGQLKPP
jgi:hypothetical protein